MSTERPILFSSPMVRAILAGRKTQTRRLVKWSGAFGFEAPVGYDVAMLPDGSAGVGKAGRVYGHQTCPYAVGDLLWVRETWAVPGRAPRSTNTMPPGLPVLYRADPDPRFYGFDAMSPWVWRPSISMPRWASRLTLRVTGVRVERLQAISEADAWAEGMAEVDPDEAAVCARAKEIGCCMDDPQATFAALWDSINGKRAAWADNPWVWVVSFAREDRP